MALSRVNSARLGLLVCLCLLFVTACERGSTGERIVGPSASSGPVPSPERSPSLRQTSGPSSSPGASAIPEGNGSFRFAVKGDWGASSKEQETISAQMCARRVQEPFSDVVTTGDNFYKPDGVASDANYYRPEGCLTAYPGHRWRAAWGNHDLAGNSTREVLGAERYYSWSAGPAQFFMLDSNQPDAAQTSWLESGLTASRAQVKIAAFHHPPFTAGTHEDDLNVRRSWVPIFERHGVSLVLSGHNHTYEHSSVNGVDYVVSGGGGANLYKCERTGEWLRKCESRHHFLLVRAGPSTTEVMAIDSNGETLDKFEVQNRGS